MARKKEIFANYSDTVASVSLQEKMANCAMRRIAEGKRGYPGAVRRALASGRILAEGLPRPNFWLGTGGPKYTPRGTTPEQYKRQVEALKAAKEMARKLAIMLSEAPAVAQ